VALSMLRIMGTLRSVTSYKNKSFEGLGQLGFIFLVGLRRLRGDLC
jgi:hypothetical protein